MTAAAAAGPRPTGGAAPPVRATLDNGLRIVVSTDPGVAATGTALVYRVGSRTESLPGAAHLFEHLMFQGTPLLPQHALSRAIHAAGGTFGATTQRDYTVYTSTVPAGALDLVLFCEADRMRELALTAAGVATQVRVVGEEVRRNIANVPYGGFPTRTMPRALFSSFANVHDGYGDVAALSQLGVEACLRFHHEHYGPGNAVLAVTGPHPADRVIAMVAAQFRDVAPRPVAPGPDLAEPVVPPRTVTVHDRLAALPAVAAGWRLPTATAPGYLPALLAGTLLAEAETSRLHRALVRPGRATQVMAAPGLSGAAYDAADPDALVAAVFHPPRVASAEVRAAVDAGLAGLAGDGPGELEVRRAARRLATSWQRALDPVGARARRLATGEALFGEPELATRAARRLLTVTPDDVAAAARAMRRSGTGTVLLTAGGHR